jgi:hypothetical protein
MNLAKSCIAALLISASLHAPASAATQAQKDIMEAAASACEDMVDAVAATGMAAAQPKLVDLRAALKKAHGFLKADVAAQLDQRAEAMTGLAKGTSKTELSLAAIETFKDIVNASDWHNAKIPKDVSMLDYTGFKLSILASDANPDWATAAKTADEAHVVWDKLVPKFKDEDLVDLAHTLDAGTVDAVKRHDAAGVLFASKLQLVSIDLIETSFLNAK